LEIKKKRKRRVAPALRMRVDSHAARCMVLKGIEKLNKNKTKFDKVY